MVEESTTPDLVELVRSPFETMDRDWDFDAIAGFFAPDAVWDLSVWGVETYKGEAAIRDFLVGYWATWEDHHHNVEQLVDLGHGVLFVVTSEDGCPKGSDSRVQARHGDVYEPAQGKIARITTGYLDIDEGRAAAGRLAESRG
jgi:ketosteroid isomerase-like protein